MVDKCIDRAMTITNYAREMRHLADIIDAMLKRATTEAGLPTRDREDIVWTLTRAKAHITDAQSELVCQAINNDES